MNPGSENDGDHFRTDRDVYECACEADYYPKKHLATHPSLPRCSVHCNKQVRLEPFQRYNGSS